MWSNLSSVVGTAIQKVQKMQSEIESQLDNAVGVNNNADDSSSSANQSTHTGSNAEKSTNKINEVNPDSIHSTENSSRQSLRQLKSNDEQDVEYEDLNNIPTPKSMTKNVSTIPEKTISPSNIPPTAPSTNVKKPKASKVGNNKQPPLTPTSATAGITPSTSTTSITSMTAASIAPTTHANEEEVRHWKGQVEILKEKLKTLQGEFQVLSTTSQQEIHTLQDQVTITRKEEEKKSEEKLKKVSRDYEEKLQLLQSQLTASTKDSEKEQDMISQEQHRLLLDHAQRQIDELKRDQDTSLLAYQHTQEELMTTKESLTKTSRLLTEREKSLESLNGSLADLHTRYEDSQSLVEELTRRLAEREEGQKNQQTTIQQLTKDLQSSNSLVKQLQDAAQTASASATASSTAAATSTAQEIDHLKREQTKLTDLLKDREEKLHAFESEGKSLAKKQSDMEKSVRQAKKELKDKDNDILKLKESKEQLVKAIEQTQEALKKQEAENNNQLKTLSAMQAVSLASSDKLTKLEAELTSKTEELLTMKRALEAAWQEQNEGKRSVTEMKNENEELRKQLGAGTSRALETETTRREIEQREMVLRATSRQLEESLQRVMQDSSVREERLREEINDMRYKWQAAIAAREALASELSLATAPLLRQISGLQEQLRIKQEQALTIETSLSERVLRAETSREHFEHKRSLLEEKITSLTSQVTSLQSKYSELMNKYEAMEGLVHKQKKELMNLTEEKQELSSKLALEVAQGVSLHASLREVEIRHSLENNNWREKLERVMKEKEKDIEKMKEEMMALTAQQQQQQMMQMMNKPSNSNSNRKSPKPNGQQQQQMKSAWSTGRLQQRQDGGDSNEQLDLQDMLLSQGQQGQGQADHNGEDGQGNGSSNNEGNNEQKRYYNNSREEEMIMQMSKLPNGEVSFVASEKLYHRNRHRQDELLALQAQISQLQVSRNALLEEVSFLSARNAQLEEQTIHLPGLQEELTAAKKQLEVLLVLLGEKEEEMEVLVSDMQEVKSMYTAHIQELMEQVMVLTTTAATGAIAGGGGSNVNLSNNSSLHGGGIGSAAATSAVRLASASPLPLHSSSSS